jgi:WD40 repeat protein/serine/threonine protein kinase
MVPRIGDCRAFRVETFLWDDLTEAERIALEEHLEACESCRARLESHAASESWWFDARRFLEPESAGGSTRRPDERPSEELRTDDATERAELPFDDSVVLRLLAGPDGPGGAARLGSYEIAEAIGAGGMGVVFKAFDNALNRFVAIKVLAPTLASSAAARRRFAREAKAAAAVTHEHVIAIFAVDTSGPLPFLVMPLISGSSLQERIDRDGPLQVREIVRIGMQTASGLASAHAQGLVHRDIKPANILLENGVGRVKITDFGLARTIDEASLTQSGVVAGTPQYMSPEQARGEPIDARADLFSLGSVLYAMCTGHSPFRAETMMAVLRRVSDDDPRPIRAINPEIPAWFEAVVAKLLAKDPAARFQSAAEVAELLTRCLAYLEDPDRLPIPYLAPKLEPVIGAVQGKPAFRPGQVRFRRGRWVLLAVALVGAGMLPTVARRHIWSATPGGATTTRSPTADSVPPWKSVRAVPPWESVRAAPGPNIGRRSLPGRFGRVLGTAYSPDGRTLAIACVDRTIRLWDVPSDSLRATLVGHKNEVRSVAFSPDGKLLVSGGGAWNDYSVPGEVKLWDLTTNVEVADLKGHASVVYAVAFSPDGKSVASASGDRTAKLWEVPSARLRSTLSGHSNVVCWVAYSPDGQSLATCSFDSTIRLWDPANGEERSKIKTRQLVCCIAFSPDGTTLASTGSERVAEASSTGNRAGGVTIWDIRRGVPLKTFDEVAVEFLCVAFSPDGATLASATSNYAMSGEVKLWNIAKGRLEAGLAHGDVPASLAYAPDGQRLAVGLRGRLANDSVMIWEVPALTSRVHPDKAR